jgi:hypothetical protein
MQMMPKNNCVSIHLFKELFKSGLLDVGPCQATAATETNYHNA